MSRLLGIALAALWLVSKAGLWRVVGWNPAESDGLGIGDGLTGRIVDPTTGAGVFNPNLNPAVVGIDPQTGALAPTGTDMSFGSAIRRQIHTNVINGDFAMLPPGGAASNIVSDPADANYNPLPGWTWTPSTDTVTAMIIPDGSYASGYRVLMTWSPPSASVYGQLEQLIAVPRSQGQQFRALLSVYAPNVGTTILLLTQFLAADLSTIGSEVTTTYTNVSECKLDAGLVPPTASYLRLRIKIAGNTSPRGVGEVRCVFPPAELPVTLATMATGTSAITTTETQVIGCTIPANTFVVGATYTVKAWFTMTSTVANVATFRLRCGATTLTGTVLTSMNPTATATATNEGYYIEATLTIRSVGAGGTAWAAIEMVAKTTQPFAVGHRVEVGSATVAVNTTQANILELTAQTAAGTTSTTGRMGLIRCEYAA